MRHFLWKGYPLMDLIKAFGKVKDKDCMDHSQSKDYDLILERQEDRHSITTYNPK